MPLLKQLKKNQRGKKKKETWKMSFKTLDIRQQTYSFDIGKNELSPTTAEQTAWKEFPGRQGSLQFPQFCFVTIKIWSDGQTSVTGLGRTSVTALCNFLGCTSVTAQFYLEIKGKYILEAWGHANPKDPKRREAPSPILAPHFICFSLPPDPTLYNWDSQECSLFYLRSSLWSLGLHLFYFCGLCLLATTILDSFCLF